jgi:hypothetical protein
MLDQKRPVVQLNSNMIRAVTGKRQERSFSPEMRVEDIVDPHLSLYVRKQA